MNMSASQMSPLCARFARRWHAELITDGVWSVADDSGHHLRRHFFTAETADAYARATDLIKTNWSTTP